MGVSFSVKVPVFGYAEWEDPCNRKVKHCRFYVRIKDLPVGLPIDPVNTRKQNINQKVYQGVVRSAVMTPDKFHFQNNGMLVLVRSFDHKEGLATLNFGKNDGVGDGAHSYLSCVEANKRTGGVSEGYITFNVISGLENRVQKRVCLFRNTSMSNRVQTRYNYEGYFDLIKREIQRNSFASKVSYKENEKKKPIQARFLVSLLSLFVYDKKNLVDCYFNKAKVLDYFVRSQKRNNTEYFKIVKLAKDIFELYELIGQEVSRVHLEENNQFGDLVFRQAKGSGRFVLPFSGKKTKVKAVDSVIFPILASLQSEINYNDSGSFSWKDFGKTRAKVKKNAKKYYSLVCNYIADNKGDTQNLGRMTDFWAIFNSKSKKS